MMERPKALGDKMDSSKGNTSQIAGLNDELLLNILRRQPPSPYPCSLVCKRWLRLQGLLKQSIKLQEWSFLESGRMKVRFPNLADVDLTRACLLVVKNGPAILLTHHGLTISHPKPKKVKPLWIILLSDFPTDYQ
ncbi:hypothetical protein O6H91_21G014200 [Diphasiastrum complanatum]|uniref:Uncharacterized protein n=1 Tax=Diphasiastrum complanatum TaxID=34168 RepID=A0ACC2AHY9_DIPCM|nr:hypothetical protein O6H91_21G014200 [Diphasiastrum complanatum]